ncbi:MAG: DUF805 domain-containing protein [Coriobacteriia bacterium]|nr:DUF805 domain-containing protein [Coriobacteriia bacterium]
MKYYAQPLRDYAVFRGRSTRAEFWVFFLVNTCVSTLLLRIDREFGWLILDAGFGYLSGFYLLGVALPSLAIGVRRLHDTGRTGVFILLPLIPLLGWLILGVLLALPSERGDNQYGRDLGPRPAVELGQGGGPPLAGRKGRFAACPWCGRSNPRGMGKCQWCHEEYLDEAPRRGAGA